MATDRYRIGEFELVVSRNQLRRGERVDALEPRAAELLAYLAARAGEVVSIEDLLGDLWAGRVVTDNSIYRQIAELRRALDDDSRAPAYIETVRKRGYRLVATVTPLAADTASDTAPSVTPRRGGWLVAGVAALVGAALMTWLQRAPDAVPVAGPEVTTLAVLPFEVLSPETPGYVAEGLSRYLTDRLAGIRELRVISTPSVQDALRDADGVAEVATRLGATMMVRGNVVANPDASVSVTASLILPATGEQVWTRRFSGNTENLVALFDDIALTTAQQFDALLPDASGIADIASSNSALARFLEGEAALAAGYQADTLNQAVAAFDAVLAERPNALLAHARRAVAHLLIYNNYYDRTPARLALARADVDKTLALDPEAAQSWYVLGYYHAMSGNAAAAQAPLERAVQRRPSMAAAHAALGRNATRLARIDVALSALAEAVRLDPRNSVYQYDLGITAFYASEFREAERRFNAALALKPGMVEPRLYLAQLYLSWLGDREAADVQMQKLAASIGTDAVLEMLIQPGLWGFFGFLSEDFTDALSNWSLADQGGEPGAWHLAMANVALNRGDLDAATRWFEQAASQRSLDVANAPTDPWLVSELAIALAGAGEDALAREAMDRVLIMAPVEEDVWTNSDFLWLRATVLALLGDVEGATEQLQRCVAYPSTITPHLLDADIFWKQVVGTPSFEALVASDRSRWRRPSL